MPQTSIFLPSLQSYCIPSCPLRCHLAIFCFGLPFFSSPACAQLSSSWWYPSLPFLNTWPYRRSRFCQRTDVIGLMLASLCLHSCGPSLYCLCPSQHFNLSGYILYSPVLIHLNIRQCTDYLRFIRQLPPCSSNRLMQHNIRKGFFPLETWTISFSKCSYLLRT